jgi:hypothetical protein
MPYLKCSPLHNATTGKFYAVSVMQGFHASVVSNFAQVSSLISLIASSHFGSAPVGFIHIDLLYPNGQVWRMVYSGPLFFSLLSMISKEFTRKESEISSCISGSSSVSICCSWKVFNRASVRCGENWLLACPRVFVTSCCKADSSGDFSTTAQIIRGIFSEGLPRAESRGLYTIFVKFIEKGWCLSPTSPICL